jgi:hypothetical protein
MIGGLGYHFRAAKFAQSHWQNYCNGVAGWLPSWKQKSSDLLLVGPSAGYSLNSTFLERYQKIWLSEPDVLARLLLRRRFSKVNFATIRADVLDDLSAYKNCDILFCNILGQLPLVKKFAQKEFAQKALVSELLTSGINFASYHDLFSFSGKFAFKKARVDVAGKVDETALLLEFLRLSQTQEITIEDHGLINVFPAACRTILHWEIIPNRHHLIECVSSNSF